MNELMKEELKEVQAIHFDLVHGITEEEEVKERFKIKDIEGANWAFRKLKAIEEKRAEINDLMKIEIERIRAWGDEDLDKMNDSANFFEGLLTEYFIVQKELDPKFKISTPYGKISSRKQAPEFVYDIEKSVNWLLQNDKDLVRVKYEPNKSEIKKKYKIHNGNLVTENGEIVEGITAEERQDSISIKVVD